MTSAVLDEITAAIGLPAAIELTRVYGGRRLQVPHAVHPIHPLCVAIGLGAAERLCAEFAGVSIDVPAERASLRALRNDAIARQYQAGASVRELAREHCLDRSMVRRIIRQAGVTLRSDPAAGE